MGATPCGYLSATRRTNQQKSPLYGLTGSSGNRQGREGRRHSASSHGLGAGRASCAEFLYWIKRRPACGGPRALAAMTAAAPCLRHRYSGPAHSARNRTRRRQQTGKQRGPARIRNRAVTKARESAPAASRPQPISAAARARQRPVTECRNLPAESGRSSRWLRKWASPSARLSDSILGSAFG